jgi:hypothetical protein
MEDGVQPQQKELVRIQTTAPSPRKRSKPALTAVFCLLFRLSRAEAQILVGLYIHDFVSTEELRVIASYDGQAVTPGSALAFISGLRRKTKPYDIGIVTMPRLGYALAAGARYKIRTTLIQFDLGRPPRRSRAPKTVEAAA